MAEFRQASSEVAWPSDLGSPLIQDHCRPTSILEAMNVRFLMQAHDKTLAGK